MANDENIKSYSAAELREMRARGESETDLTALRNANPETLEQAALDQMAEDGIPLDWIDHAKIVMPEPKKLISLRLDNDVVEWFRAQGPGYQTRINAILKAYVKHTAV